MEKSDDSADVEQVYCFKCSKCDFISLEKSAVAQHLSNHSNKTTDLVSFHQSTKHESVEFDDGTNETSDMGSKIGNKETKGKTSKRRCKVANCSIRLNLQENIEYHYKCHYQDSFRCPECNETMSPWRIMSLHLWKNHSIDMELHSCNLCDYKTSKSELLKFHINTHSNERSFLCDQCGKGFKNMKQLRNHKDLHTTEKTSAQRQLQNTCDICGKVLSNGRLMRAHKNAVHLKVRTHLCNYCGYNTTSQSNLRIHLRQHTGEKPFTCSDCDYRTADHNSLRRHRMKHSGEKRYKCPHCTYASIQSSTYKAHLRSKHPGLSDQLIFSCQLCSYRTVRKENLDLHNVTIHNSTYSESLQPIYSNGTNHQQCHWDADQLSTL